LLRFQFVRHFALYLILLLSVTFSFAQKNDELYRGYVKGHPMTFGEITIKDESGKTLTTTKASVFEITLPRSPYLIFGFIEGEKVFGKYVKSQAHTDTIEYGTGISLIGAVEIRAKNRGSFMQSIKPRELELNVGVGSSIENLIKTLGGVSSNNEMSSQFSVRGGNFDENLIYVNDIEIYRPQLIQNGQQEGLSFIHSNLVEEINFSTGGFSSEYGDKMSSVLDVSYIKPDSQEVIATLGTMLNSFGYMGKHKSLSGILSFRHFSNSLLTGTLNTDGTYSMNFADAQAFIKWDINRFWSLDFLGNYARNAFQLIPESRTTEFGTIQNAYQLNVFMAGQENLNYEYQLGALTLNYTPSFYSRFKWIASVTSINEEEYFDVQGAYSLNELDRDLGSDNLGSPLRTLGYGYYLDHGRNRMQSRIINVSHLGEFGKKTASSQFKYGIRLNQELIQDRFYEWLYSDSADYNLAPWSTALDSIILDDVVRANNEINSTRINGYAQLNQYFGSSKKLWLNAGIRSSYWSLNNEWLIMPRVAFYYEPNKRAYKNQDTNSFNPKTVLRFAFGAYHQPPFYRELRNFSGQINPSLRAQKSWHYVLGLDRTVRLWGKDFKYSAEAYYKQLSDIVPYIYDNIRIRYYAQNSSNGYAMGFDNRLYGQFNDGLESWFTLSFLKTEEQINYVDDAGNPMISEYLRRPTDRRVNFSAIFQDRLPSNPSVRVNLSLIIGSAIPYYLDGSARYSTTPSIIPAYRRVDIGFSKVLKDKNSKGRNWKWVKEAWVSLDIFNLLDINNVIAYSWVKDLNNNRYGVPEYLTGRMLNLRIQAKI